MVMFIDGKPQRKGFRRFKIKNVIGQDDPACMNEVVYRRLSRLVKEERLLPDLLLIDGGRTQLNAALKAVMDLDLYNKLEIISIAKKFEEIYIPQFPEPVCLPKDSASIRLLQRIRDEAHKYAIEYHRMLRSRSSMSSLLEEVPGVGPKITKKLLTAFKSLNDIKEASIEDINIKAKVPERIAKMVKEFLSITLVLLFVLVGCYPHPRFHSGIAEQGKRVAPKQQQTQVAKKTIEKPRKESHTYSIDFEDRIMGAINRYLGTPYVYGGENLLGMDCSGFVMTVFLESNAIVLPRTVKTQIKRGKAITGKKRFGDLIFFHMENNSPDHVGIYIGYGRFAHASRSKGVTISKLEGYFEKRIHSVRRL
jgi:hypothetical protein